ncbi:linear amide C-N hydrolase [Vagococcus penaei]|uniref:Uncharacterized protein n=1 Tax=Vagococcus penaei TaxID=633807 RepID=A0A1Q2D529_9ENTE|nr:linear amide C-N hydrolase [Vagococcus penaei]AQP53385.1 hypothetical protein BW732_03460 [Vagococcus penaei]RST99707.1 linear amide C-N hydrolase [Vagococcus penaei]
MCTNAAIQSQEGHFYWARTMDFPMNFFDNNGVLKYFGKKEPIQFVTEKITPSYDFIGMGLGDGNLTVMDGINSEGLVGGLFYFEEFTTATESELAKKNKKPVAINEMVTYFLAQCRTIGDVAYLASQLAVIDKTTTGQPGSAPLHLTFMDTTGESVILEPDHNGEFTIHRNVTHTMTNSPTYDWHVTNLRNYVNLSGFTIDQLELGDLIIKDIESGSGLLGLPGDYTSPSRFIKITLLTHLMDQPEDKTALKDLYRVFNSVIIPKGIEKNTPTISDYTSYWIGYNIEKREFIMSQEGSLSFSCDNLDSIRKHFKGKTGELPFTSEETFKTLTKHRAS